MTSARPLFDPLHATNRWRVRGQYIISLRERHCLPGGFALLVVLIQLALQPRRPTPRRLQYPCGRHLGPWEGVPTTPETSELKQPDEPMPIPALRGQVPFIPPSNRFTTARPPRGPTNLRAPGIPFSASAASPSATNRPTGSGHPHTRGR